jgi:serine protease Do
VVITDVSPNTAAADRGLKPGDVIMEVQQGEVSSPADVQKQVDAARGADRKFVLMLIQREGGVQYVPLSLSKAPAVKDKQPG